MFSYQPKQDYPLILLAHRDEFTERPTAALDWWQDEPDILGGRDLSMQGSWLAVHRNGRLAAITNVRQGPLSPAKLSRGAWIKNHLLAAHSAIDTAAACAASQGYGPFNGLFATHGPHGLAMAYGSNVYAAQSLSPGTYALSNGAFNAPWPKAQKAINTLHTLLHSQTEPSTDWLYALRDTRVAEDEHLPNTGIGLEKERWLSPVLITGEHYGTRAASLVQWRKDGEIRVHEQTLAPEKNGEILHERSFKFEVSAR